MTGLDAKRKEIIDAAATADWYVAGTFDEMAKSPRKVYRRLLALVMCHIWNIKE